MIRTIEAQWLITIGESRAVSSESRLPDREKGSETASAVTGHVTSRSRDHKGHVTTKVTCILDVGTALSRDQSRDQRP